LIERSVKKSRPLGEPEQEKLRGASIFEKLYDRARNAEKYVEIKREHGRRNE
jgi:hypothetical protein